MNETVAIANYIGLSAVIFFIGVAGVLTRRNPLIILMAIELMWNAANLALVAFAKSWLNNAGHIFVFLVVTVAAAEAVRGKRSSAVPSYTFNGLSLENVNVCSVPLG